MCSGFSQKKVCFQLQVSHVVYISLKFNVSLIFLQGAGGPGATASVPETKLCAYKVGLEDISIYGIQGRTRGHINKQNISKT